MMLFNGRQLKNPALLLIHGLENATTVQIAHFLCEALLQPRQHVLIRNNASGLLESFKNLTLFQNPLKE